MQTVSSAHETAFHCKYYNSASELRWAVKCKRHIGFRLVSIQCPITYFDDLVNLFW